jgi:hypothetical protein
MIRSAFPLLATLGALAGCGGSSPADNAASQLESAADQSSPAAANVLDNAADQLRDSNVTDTNAAVQGAMQAGNAQAAQPAAAPPGRPSPPTVGAKPHAAGDPVPPPKLKAGKGVTGGTAPTGEEG